MTRIIHISDLHGTPRSLPEADIYISTGDHLPNSRNLWLYQDKSFEAQFQNDWIKTNVDEWSNIFANKNAPLIVVRGNHSFVDELPLFAGHAGFKYEFKEPDIIDVLGYKIGGFRGVPPINDVWSDELDEGDIDFRVSQLYNINILVTHGPPYKILDEGNHYGSTALRDYVKNPKNTSLSHQFFGHCHRDGGKTLNDGKVFYSNAACNVNIIDI